MSTRMKIAQSSCIVAVFVCIVALIYDDLTGYREDEVHLICGWNGICIKPTNSAQYDCILYQDCSELNLTPNANYNCNKQESNGGIYLGFTIASIIIATFTLFIKKCNPNHFGFRLFNLISGILCIISSSLWIDQANIGFPCYDTNNKSINAYIGLSIWFLYTATCLFFIAACLSFKERVSNDNNKNNNNSLIPFRKNKNKQSVDYKDLLSQKQEEQKKMDKQRRRNIPKPGIVFNVNYNSIDDNTQNENNDSMYNTQELVPISSLTSTQ